MPLEALRDFVGVVDDTHVVPFRTHYLGLADRIALLIALLIAATASYCWLLGIIGLWGKPQFRFADAMIIWGIEVELALALPAWLLMKIITVIVRMKAVHHA